MSVFDTSVTVAVLNLFTLVGNILWTIKFKAIQGNDTLIRALTDQVDAKSVLLEEQTRELTNLKLQYEHQTRQLTHLKAENETYKQLNHHHLPTPSN